jgi:Secretion system C-terminal sorting domain
MRKFILTIPLLFFIIAETKAQQSVARRWNEQNLQAIRDDLARPPVQARNLFHIAIAMYDAWAAYDAIAKPYLLGKTIGGIYYPFAGITPVSAANLQAAREKAISYAAYRVLINRYSNSPNAGLSISRFNALMNTLGYDINYTSSNYLNNDPADLGNYIAQKVIAMGLVDGSRQSVNYNYLDYNPINTIMNVSAAGNPIMEDPNRWQPLFIAGAFDQNGNPIPATQRFICPEWGRVLPFAMPTSLATMHNYNGTNYPVYYDPGAPPKLDTVNVNSTSSQDFKWGHTMVVAWSAHLDPTDGVMWDISPNSIGNITTYPTTQASQRSFYNFTNGGDIGTGYTLNPVTGVPYTPQLVKRGDFTRIASQYWADGPSSETPPGHWFKLLNDVSDNPLFVKKYEGTGSIISNLEWDVKAYFTLGGSLHDAAIACWSVKGWYDSPRPISAIRKMAKYGQSSNNLLPSYHPGGLPLIPGLIELVNAGDPLQGTAGININKVKIKAWRGFSFIVNPYDDIAGVGWILAENWVPYQTTTFVTPPFAGYLSGHSTYSRAGAQTLTMLTGSPYFPGGLAEYVINANSFYTGFEAGPTTNIRLQWASYKDASDQASLSRIWGGIHPPFDDVPGRLIGEQIGIASHNKAKTYFNGSVVPIDLIAFTGKEKDCSVQLNWSTATEQNAKSFILYRSEDGIKYNSILGEIKAAGNSSIVQHYIFNDVTPLLNNYYKLVQKDFDGTAKELPIVFVPLKKCIIQSDYVSIISPNPIADNINFTITNKNNSIDANFVVTDVLGSVVLSKNVKLQSGINKINMDATLLLQGTYFVKVNISNSKPIIQKIIKLKD